MEVTILERDEFKARFIIRETSVALANALRRIMISEVACMAIDEVAIIENSSVLYDEVLAHRLAMIPLTTPSEGYVMPNKCKCGGAGCFQCQARLYLDVKWDGEGERVVYSGELRSEDERVRPVYDNIPIVKLAKDQKVVLEAYATLGLGRMHAKWQPTSACAYKYMPIVMLNTSLCDECGKCIESCPKKILELHEGVVRASSVINCILCKECEKVCEREALKIGWDESSFIFLVESTGTMKVLDIILKAVKVLELKVRELDALLSKGVQGG